MRIAKISLPVGMIVAILLFIYTVSIEFWSKLDGWAKFLLGIAFIVLFLSDFGFELSYKVETKNG